MQRSQELMLRSGTHFQLLFVSNFMHPESLTLLFLCLVLFLRETSAFLAVYSQSGLNHSSILKEEKFLWNCQNNLKNWFRTKNRVLLLLLLRFHIETNFYCLSKSCRNALWLLRKFSSLHLPLIWCTPCFNKSHKKSILGPLSVWCLVYFLTSTFFYLLFLHSTL